ncbi:uncharacterized protein DUF4174 [Litoreibacter ponti]|uniref:Uncharacterized protein DUF4174 n=1 Tax=Litoreibacter ponti TaxID=1510457 RepID=A0A2T6BKQ6_9RHOB|nr:DUF4174 domain-containing protein [Litoreibacter ponti]PTX56641.1 uncharacterized protein DUF4174 [Litoreibacter ponti]
MKYATAFVLTAFFAAAAGAQTTEEAGVEAAMEVVPMDEVEVNLNDFLWTKRPVVVFADTDADPRFQRQMELLSERLPELEARDVVILTDTDPSSLSPLRKKLRPRGFMLVLIGKDGGVKLRKPFPWDVREISRSIDKMPLRLQELRDQRAAQDAELND